MKKYWILLPLFWLLGACVSAPAGLEKTPSMIQSLRNITAGDEACACKSVRLGGKVLNATALKSQTRLEVLSLPVASFSAKPVLDAMSDGRFVAYVDGFVDPETLKDQYITVVGVLKGVETGKIDQADYRYPLIHISQMKRWKLAQEYYYDPDDWADYWEDRRRGFYFIRPEPRLRNILY